MAGTGGRSAICGTSSDNDLEGKHRQGAEKVESQKGTHNRRPDFLAIGRVVRNDNYGRSSGNVDIVESGIPIAEPILDEESIMCARIIRRKDGKLDVPHGACNSECRILALQTKRV
jgi:hypothetical protein